MFHCLVQNARRSRGFAFDGVVRSVFIARQRSHGVRILVAAAIVLAHLAALSTMLKSSWLAPSAASKDIFSELIPIDADGVPARAEPNFNRAMSLSTFLIAPDLDAPSDLDFEPPAISDWMAQGEQAAAGVVAAAGANVRAFGSLQHPAAGPRKVKPFGWDKAHTNRVAALPEGGIVIRLSERCELVLHPLPFGGCSLGKIEARGDLFEQMNAPVEMGDGQDSAVTHR